MMGKPSFHRYLALFTWVLLTYSSNGRLVQALIAPLLPPPPAATPTARLTTTQTGTTTIVLPLSAPIKLASAMLVEPLKKKKTKMGGSGEHDSFRHWESLVPTVWQEPRGLDMTVHWKTTNTNNTNDVAHACLEAANEWWDKLLVQQHNNHFGSQLIIPPQRRALMVNDLAESMQQFVNFCQMYLRISNDDNNKFQNNKASMHHHPVDNDVSIEQEPPQPVVSSFKARVVCTRGGPASTKCPQYHTDHVPVRWIQALVGPGCEWVDPHVVQWDRIQQALTRRDDDNDDDDNDDNDSFQRLPVHERNRRLVRSGPSSHHHHQARTGQAVLLLGNAWSKWARRRDNDHNTNDELLQPCVHKSPAGLPPWQGRVLLTMDVCDCLDHGRV